MTLSTSSREANASPDEHGAPVTTSGRGRVIHGIIGVGVASVIMRGGGLIAQFVAGWKLSKEDFGLFAVTLAFSTLAVAALSALRPLLIERLTRGAPVDRLWRFVLYLLSGAAALVAVFAGPLAHALGADEAQQVLIVIAPTLPLQFANIIGLARLASEHRFTRSSQILTASALVRHGSLVALALLGFGVYSLVLPLYAESLIQFILLRRSTGAYPKLIGSVRGTLGTYGSTLGWLALTTVSLAASLNGDYLAIKPFESLVIVGGYFFGYQLSAAITQPFSMAATNVLVPSFASLTDQDRLRRSYLDAISVLLLTTGIAFGGLALVGGPLIDILWGGKWNYAIVAMVLISAGTPLRILLPTCFSLLQGMGRWSSHSLLAAFNAVVAICAAIAGAIVGGLFEIALFVGIAGALVGLIVPVITGLHVAAPPKATLSSLARGALPAVAGLGAAFGYSPVLLPSLTDTAIRVAIFLAVSGGSAFILFRRTLAGMVVSLRTPTKG